MSATVRCEVCGGWKDIPAFEGDGVYTTHVCTKDEEVNQMLPKQTSGTNEEEA